MFFTHHDRITEIVRKAVLVSREKSKQKVKWYTGWIDAKNPLTYHDCNTGNNPEGCFGKPEKGQMKVVSTNDWIDNRWILLNSIDYIV